MVQVLIFTHSIFFCNFLWQQVPVLCEKAFLYFCPIFIAIDFIDWPPLNQSVQTCKGHLIGFQSDITWHNIPSCDKLLKSEGEDIPNSRQRSRVNRDNLRFPVHTCDLAPPCQPISHFCPSVSGVGWTRELITLIFTLNEKVFDGAYSCWKPLLRKLQHSKFSTQLSPLTFRAPTSKSWRILNSYIAIRVVV